MRLRNMCTVPTSNQYSLAVFKPLEGVVFSPGIRISIISLIKNYLCNQQSGERCSRKHYNMNDYTVWSFRINAISKEELMLGALSVNFILP